MKIVTFYSYKGGVGRTMCLANIAVLLAKWGHKVLMVDWDWEAPGLERYFVSENFNGKANNSTAGIDLSVVKEKPGLVDLLTERKKDSWKEALITIPIPDAREPLHFISAGRRDDDYFKRVRDFNVETFYSKKKGGQYIEELRRAWWEAYDFILIDSRTGVSEINGISTIQMPNLVVLLFTATNQSFEGVLDIAHRSASAQQKLPYDRGKLLFLPILSRVEVAVGHLTDEWVARFSKDLTPLYNPWLPTENPNVKPDEFLMKTKIPHDPYYTFGEKLAVVKDGTIDPARMGYAYEGIASLVANKLERVEVFVEEREGFIKKSEGSTEQPSVYVSYSHKDINATIEVIEYLKNNGCRVISDFDSMEAGEHIKTFIDRAQESDYYLIVISQNSLLSSWFIYEVSRFLKKRNPNNLIPICIDRAIFDDKFLFEALNSFLLRIQDLEKVQKRLKDEGINVEYLTSEITRLSTSRLQLPQIISSLRDYLLIEITGDAFESNMSRVLKRIKS